MSVLVWAVGSKSSDINHQGTSYRTRGSAAKLCPVLGMVRLFFRHQFIFVTFLYFNYSSPILPLLVPRYDLKIELRGPK